jgi:hypothetical protein
LHHGIRIAVMHYSVQIIHSFDQLRSTFAMKGQVADALADSYGAVNAVSLYLERRPASSRRRILIFS